MCGPSCNCLIAVADQRFPLLLALVLLTLGSGAQTANLTLSTDQDSVGMGEPLTLSLISDEPLIQGQRWNWPSLSVGDTLAQGWEIVGVSELDSMSSPVLDAGIRRQQRLMVLAWDTGVKVIEPLRLTLDSSQVVSSEPLLIEVGLVPIEANPAPKPLQGYSPFAWTLWERIWHYLPFVLLALAAAFLGWWGWKKWKQRESSDPILAEASVPKEPAHVLALRILHGLKKQQPWMTGDGKEAQALLSEAVRLHLHGTFDVKALERATEELTSLLSQGQIRGLDPLDAQWLIGILRQSDLVKFAKQTMGNDAHLMAVNDAIKWVERTQPVDDPMAHQSGDGHTIKPSENGTVE